MRIRTRLPFAAAVLLLVLLACIVHPERADCSVSDEAGPSPEALAAGLSARRRHRASVRSSAAWTLIDYSLPFTAVRLWVLDGQDATRVVMASRVSHAWKSGLLYATRFSNQDGSHLSSAGSYVTALASYDGRFGHSLRVRGLDPGENDNVWKRAIIFHPDLGMTHSLGCFMLPDAHARAIVDAIAGGTFVHVHRPR
jgi:hypothetical protein